MRIDTLKFYASAQGIRQSELARRVGVSRQVVSHWFRSPAKASVNVYSRHLLRLAETFGVPMEALEKEPPLSDADRQAAHTQLLWDHLYPSLEDFARALNRGQPEALARAVQVYGLFGAEKLAGKKVWKKFPLYKQKMHPAYRRKAEAVWNVCNPTPS